MSPPIPNTDQAEREDATLTNEAAPVDRLHVAAGVRLGLLVWSLKSEMVTGLNPRNP
jgi:hypothetical protein